MWVVLVVVQVLLWRAVLVVVVWRIGWGMLVGWVCCRWVSRVLLVLLLVVLLVLLGIMVSAVVMLVVLLVVLLVLLDGVVSAVVMLVGLLVVLLVLLLVVKVLGVEMQGVEGMVGTRCRGLVWAVAMGWLEGRVGSWVGGLATSWV